MTDELTFQDQYKVTARKWRPQVFSDVTSQEIITKTLRNSVKNNRISHAYLFSGPRGVGKTTVARLLAKSLNCKDRKPDGEPCNECDSCREINNDNRNHPDVFEIDGASNRNIDDVRELKEKVKYGPLRSRYKIFIIDEVHMLTGASFNALLKTLEEPPDYIVFIFATTAPEKVPLTILGRCQKFDFRRLSIDEIKARLIYIAENEKVSIDDESLFFIAKKGDGSMRDAQGLFDMASVYCDNQIIFPKLKSFFNLVESDVYFSITDMVRSRDADGLLKYFDDLMNRGYDMQAFLAGLTEHLRNLLVAVSTNSGNLILESEPVKKKYVEQTGKFSAAELINYLRLILDTEYTFKYSSNQRTLIEALLVEMIKLSGTKDISSLIEELKELGSSGQGSTPFNTSSTAKAKNETTVNYETIKDTPGKETLPAPAEENIPAADLTDDLGSHWGTIKDQIRSERKWVYSILKDTSFERDEKSNYLIRIEDSRYELLDSYKDYLAGKISSYFGQTVKISLIRNSEFVSTHSTAQPKGTAAGENDNFEKIRSILANDFNAKDVIE